MTSEDELSSIVSSIYEAAIHPEHWTQVLQQLTACFNGVGAVVGYRDIANQHGGVPAAYNLDPAILASYEAYYHAHDIWASRALRHKAGSILTSDDLVDRRDLTKSEFYTDFLQALDIHDLLGVSLANNSSAVGFLSIYRSEHMGGFQPADVAQMRILTGHLQRAARISSRLAQLQSANRLSDQTLDDVVHPVLIVDRHRIVQSANSAARDLLARADGLVSNAGRLGAVRQEDTRAIESGIAEALQATSPAPAMANTIAVTRFPARDHYGLTLIPISYESSRDLLGLSIGSQTAISIWVSEPNPASVINSHTFARQHRLTSSETRILEMLAQDHTMQDVADRLQLSKETIRTHLRNMFQKTGTNRQSQLISRMIRSAPPVTEPD